MELLMIYLHYANQRNNTNTKTTIQVGTMKHSDWLSSAGGHTIGDLYILYSVYAKKDQNKEEEKWKQKNEVKIRRKNNTHEMKWNETNSNV